MDQLMRAWLNRFLMSLICALLFVAFMALRPAPALPGDEAFNACIRKTFDTLKTKGDPLLMFRKVPEATRLRMKAEHHDENACTCIRHHLRRRHGVSR